MESITDVLPPLKPIKGLKPLRSWRDLFTDEEWVEIQQGLREMAEARRRSAASALASTTRY